uniref:Uncharacterized protein n=1 Tax=Zea mays TaxID=4577 RepID=A0A804P926_MAIZE
SSPPPLTPRKRVSQAKRRPTPASIPGPETRLPGRDAASHGNGAARQRRVGRAGGRRRRRRRPLAGGLVRGAAVRRGLGVRAAEVRRLLRRLPRAAGGGRREVAGVQRRPRGAPRRRRGSRVRRVRHLRELRRRARRRALDPRARRPHPPRPRRRQARPRRLLRPPDPVPGAGRAHGAVGQGLGHRGELHPPDGGGGAAVRAAEAARAHAGDRVPPGRGVGAAPRRRGAGAVRQDPRRDVPPRRPRHGRPGPPGVQQGRPHEHRRPPPPPQPHTGLPGGSGQDELRRAAAGQGAVEQGVQGLPQGKAPVVAAARCGAIAGGNWGGIGCLG